MAQLAPHQHAPHPARRAPAGVQAVVVATLLTLGMTAIFAVTTLINALI